MSSITAVLPDGGAPEGCGAQRLTWAGGAGTLHIKCSLRRVRRSICDCLKLAGTAHEACGESIAVRTDDVARLALDLAGGLTAEQQALARANFRPDEGGAGPALDACCLRCFLGKAQSRWLTGLLRPGGLTSVFQPIVRCGTNQVFGFEALMRGDDGRQIIEPERMLAAAREAGLILQLDMRACHTALSEAARHRVSTKLFINVTPSAFCGGGRGVARALRALERLRLSPHQIVFELVEGEQVADWKKLRAALGRYREHGFQVALDDFGVAYSSPISLYELRPDYVKLDGSLTRNVHQNERRASLVWKLIEAARELGASIIAEGVESAGEYRWATERGVEYAQGFYISRPAAPPPFMNSNQ